MATFDAKSLEVLSSLRQDYPKTPFLALGQTIWWDEPVKAVLCKMLADANLGGRFVFGVHDTDYFAKARPRGDGQRFTLLPHNDGSTRDLWSAAGEISTLFGSETFPTRHTYREHGVPLKSVLRSKGAESGAFLDERTEAWGWRGLVYSGSRDLIVRDLPLDLLGDAVERLLDWGFSQSISRLVDACCREEATRLGSQLTNEARAFREAHPMASLCALYRHLAPRLFALLLGAEARCMNVTCTSDLLRLAPETASLPRFDFLGLFLAEKTRSLAVRAYNEAVAGSEIYTLDRFGLGALPFDVVSPEVGRGTLRVTLRAVHIETRQPLRIPLEEPIETVDHLAKVLERALGKNVAVVGKAVALVSMLAREFIFVFNEEGSGYVRLTRRMNDALAARSIQHHVHPILRMRYRTWDSLEVGVSTLSLPSHLAAAFGTRQLPSADFASRWREAVREQRELLGRLQTVRGTRALLRFLAETVGEEWKERLELHGKAIRDLKNLRKRASTLQERINACYAELSAVRTSIRLAERAMGDHFRGVAEWTDVETAKRETLAKRIGGLHAERRRLLSEIAELKSSRLQIERGEQAEAARRRLAKLTIEAEERRMALVRDAVLTMTSLEHTNHRPTAWWLPMVDPAGRWFERIAETAELYLEPLETPLPS